MNSKPKYQKRHYEEAAQKVQEAPAEQKDFLITMFVQMFEPDNARFDAERFRTVASGRTFKATRTSPKKRRAGVPPVRNSWQSEGY